MTRRQSLILNIAGAVGLVLLINGLIFGLGWGSTGSDDGPIGILNPPGAVVGGVWVLLFAALGFARWHLATYHSSLLQARSLEAIIALCLAYPFYAIAPDSPLLAFIGTIITLLATFVVINIIRDYRRAVAVLIALCCWLAFASLLTAQKL